MICSRFFALCHASASRWLRISRSSAESICRGDNLNRWGRTECSDEIFTSAVVIGAGPYGLSVAAHLRGHGVPVRVFGDVMSSWRQPIPVVMCLKSAPDAWNLSALASGYGLADFSAASRGQPLTGHQVVPIELFARYGEWFQQQLIPDVEAEQVCRLDHAAGRFHLTLSLGERFYRERW